MDYKEKYEKALERAKYALTTDMDNSGHWAVKHIFPELKESEDEKMVKAIIKALQSHSNSYNKLSSNGIQMEDAIAWLNKQVPTKISEEDEKIRKEILSLIQYTKGRRIGYEPRIHQDEMLAWLEKQGNKVSSTTKEEPELISDWITWINEKRYSQKDVDDAYLKGVFDAKHELEKNGKQKHINDTDEEIVKAAKEYREMRERCGIKDPIMLDEIEEAYYEGAISRKSAEWSDEDERIIDNLISELANLCTRKLIKEGTKYKYVNWLKSLKNGVQPQTKERSEEDEKMANDLIKGCLTSESPYQLTHTSKEIADWLKSLKERKKGKEE